MNQIKARLFITFKAAPAKYSSASAFILSYYFALHRTFNYRRRYSADALKVSHNFSRRITLCVHAVCTRCVVRELNLLTETRHNSISRNSHRALRSEISNICPNRDRVSARMTKRITKPVIMHALSVGIARRRIT